MNSRVIAAAVAGVAILIAAIFMIGGGVSTTTNETKVQVGGGPFEGAKIKDCVPPGTTKNLPQGLDNFFGYPTGSDRDYDATGQKNSDNKPVTVLSRDNAEMYIPVTVRFNLVSDCETLKRFHKQIGERYTAYLDGDGAVQQGWYDVLRKFMYDPIDVTLDEIAKKYTWRELLNDAEAQNELESTLKKQISTIVDNNARGHFFENYTVLVKKPKPVSRELVAAVAQEQAAVASAASAEAKAKAQKTQADAETLLANANAKKQAAEIRGFGGFENYAKTKAIEKGLNPFQPTYKVSDTQ